jgi:hypothetical protein
MAVGLGIDGTCTPIYAPGSGEYIPYTNTPLNIRPTTDNAPPPPNPLPTIDNGGAYIIINPPPPWNNPSPSVPDKQIKRLYDPTETYNRWRELKRLVLEKELALERAKNLLKEKLDEENFKVLEQYGQIEIPIPSLWRIKIKGVKFWRLSGAKFLINSIGQLYLEFKNTIKNGHFKGFRVVYLCVNVVEDVNLPDRILTLWTFAKYNPKYLLKIGR